MFLVLFRALHVPLLFYIYSHLPTTALFFFANRWHTQCFLNPSSGRTFCWCVSIFMCYPLCLKFIWSFHGKNLEGNDLGISITSILFYLKIWSRLGLTLTFLLGKILPLPPLRCEPYQTSITLNIIKFGSRDCICQAAIGISEGSVLFVLDITLWVCLHQISAALP